MAVEQQRNFLAHALPMLRLAVGDVDARQLGIQIVPVGHGGQGFVGGDYLDGVDHLDRALRGGVERPHAVDFVPPELDSRRILRADGEDVDNPAAPADGSGRVNGASEGVAHAPAAFERILHVQDVARANGLAREFERIPIERPLGDGQGGRDDDGRRGFVRLRERFENANPRLRGARVRSQALEGQRLRLREVVDAGRVGCPRAERLVKPPRFLRLGDDNQRGYAQVIGKRGYEERNGLRRSLRPPPRRARTVLRAAPQRIDKRPVLRGRP